MSWSIKNWQRNRILQQEGIPESIWQNLIPSAPKKLPERIES
jgi:hypothetical protein